jgi:hypothetical protein
MGQSGCIFPADGLLKKSFPYLGKPFGATHAD